MVIKKSSVGYKVEHGGETFYFDTKQDAKSFGALVGIFEMRYDERYPGKRKLFKAESYATFVKEE